MNPVPPAPEEQAVRRTNRALGLTTIGFLLLGAGMIAGLRDGAAPRPALALVDPAFLDVTAWRSSYADLVRAGEDLSDFKCYVCHEKDQPPPLQFDAQHNLLIPDEHGNITMGHGTHNRNNLCYNCHNEANLETLHVRAGPELRWDQSTQLCGSCHGPTLRDWEGGVHGRTNGHWDRRNGQSFHRLDCVNCHNPHQPSIPGREPAPGPNLLRPGKPAAH